MWFNVQHLMKPVADNSASRYPGAAMGFLGLTPEADRMY